MAARTKEQIARLIQELREQRGLAQSEVANVLDVGKSVMSRIESGERGLAVMELAALSACLNVAVEEILFSEEAEEVLMRADDSGEQADAVQYADELIDRLLALDALVH